MLPRFQLLRPSSVDEAVRELSQPKTLVHAGGSDLLGCLREQILTPTRLVSIGGIDALRGVRQVDGALHIGALTTLATLASHEAIRRHWPGLAQAALAAASPQLRHQGTIGGNLCQKPRCWYYRGQFHCLRKGGKQCFAMGGENQLHSIFGGEACVMVHPSDTAPMLVALGATVRIAGPQGTRELPVEQLHVPPQKDPQREVALAEGELLTHVVLPPAPAGLRTSYRKVRGRQSWDFALCSVALALTLSGRQVSGGRVVLGGVAPVPWRAREAERHIVGRALDRSAIQLAARGAVKDADPLTHNDYKVAMTRGVVAEALEALALG